MALLRASSSMTARARAGYAVAVMPYSCSCVAASASAAAISSSSCAYRVRALAYAHMTTVQKMAHICTMKRIKLKETNDATTDLADGDDALEEGVRQFRLSTRRTLAKLIQIPQCVAKLFLRAIDLASEIKHGEVARVNLECVRQILHCRFRSQEQPVHPRAHSQHVGLLLRRKSGSLENRR